MKKVLSLLVIVFCLSKSLAQERILSYHTQITVEASGDLLVQEDITVIAEGNDIKGGIYRTFPTKYKDKLGTRFNVEFQVIEVLKNGNPEPFFTETKGNGVIVYIGDKNRLLSAGEYAYTLVYKTNKQIGFFKNYDELYFNAIGGDWMFPIEEASVSVELPNGATILQMDAFSGVAGTKSCDCDMVSNNNRLTITTNRVLMPQEQLTFAVAWPKGLIKEPGTIEKWWSFFKSNFHVLFVLLGLFFVTSIYYKAWKKVGVDPPKGTIIPLFDPPAGFSPGDIAVLHVLNMAQRMVTASIVSLAIKQHIKISYIKKKYSLERVSTDTGALTEEEIAIANALFSKEATITLDNKNHATFTKARTDAYNAIKKKLKPTYFSFNYNHLTKGIIASVIMVVFAFILSPSPVIPILFAVVLIIVLAIFTYLIKAPTIKGRAVMDEIEGFKMYINVAEQKQLDALHAPEITPERFEALLPYAIALGVENQWGKKFENALSKSLQETKSYSPSWYTGAAAGMAFSPARFSSDMGKSFSTAISSASTPPGSSSGSGGGGSSGGGGGGGGGGGW
ncbi:DUF2207 domain-containing protein [Paucihalobacter ruber]|uniref:DUF2207 domain-containing protein n=1 Tax=Paucihalobacter ruber TaxID=2567861 RepID=A0A506PQC8_9FLAO|nr:DUF2207 domain-containing protein [Paucihalobacter ruber]TPV35412.1 DUF2207 domain-containing protein [Paucihalobacter ruber]